MIKVLTNLEFSTAVMTASVKATKPYDLNDYNCTDFAIDVFNASQSASNKLNVANSSVGFTTPVGLYKALNHLRLAGDTDVSNISGTPPESTNCN